MQDYFKIYGRLLKINFADLLAYRFNFINNAISTVLWSAFQIIWINVLTYKSKTLFNWTQPELIILTISFIIISGFQHTFVSTNFKEMAKTINYGLLDSFLIKPVDSQFLLSLRIVDYGSFARIIFGILALIVALNKFNIHPSFLNVISYILLLFLALITIYSVWFITMAFLIWFPQLDNLVGFLYDFNGIIRYPKEMIIITRNIFLYFLLPITIIAATPTKTLFNKFISGDILALVVISGLFFWTSRVFWRFALRHYTSAS